MKENSEYIYRYSDHFTSKMELFLQRIPVFKLVFMFLASIGIFGVELYYSNRVFYFYFSTLFFGLIVVLRGITVLKEHDCVIKINKNQIEIIDRLGNKKIVNSGRIIRCIYAKSSKDFVIVYNDNIPRDINFYHIDMTELEKIKTILGPTLKIRLLDTPMG